MQLPQGTILQNGRYRIVRFIASGGFGSTYEGVQTDKGGRIAIKELFVRDLCNRVGAKTVSVGITSKVDDFNRIKSSFLKEAFVLYQMRNPNIVRVTDMFEENGTAYYVMDYIDGSSLSDIVSARGKLTESEALGYIGQVCDALKYVHCRNRLHLDIKPGNIMVDRNGKAVLIDFGTSKFYDEETGEQTSELLGMLTKSYAPLEQINRSFNTFNLAADIYALGATLYKLLTGVTPVSALDRLLKHDQLQPLPPSISEPTRKAVEAAMQLYNEDRPQSIEEFERILYGKSYVNDALNSETINPNPTRTFYNPSFHKAPGATTVIRGKGTQRYPEGETHLDEIEILDDRDDERDTEKLGQPSNVQRPNNLNNTNNQGTIKNVNRPNNLNNVNRPNNLNNTYNQGDPTTILPKSNQPNQTNANNHSNPNNQTSNQHPNQSTNLNYNQNPNPTVYQPTNHNNNPKSNQYPNQNAHPINHNTNPNTNHNNTQQPNQRSNQNIPLTTPNTNSNASSNASSNSSSRQSQKPITVRATASASSKTKILIVAALALALLVGGVFIFKSINSNEHHYAHDPYSEDYTDEFASDDVVEAVADEGFINGHEYVDLGLPSGTKWATSNIGASNMEDYGYYFSWGAVYPDSCFNEGSSQTFGKDINYLYANGFIDDEGHLTSRYDAARQQWGGTWRIPTYTNFEELIDNSTCSHTTLNGVGGLLITSNINGKYIFLPASGWYFGATGCYVGKAGAYWTSSPIIDPRYASAFSFSDGGVKVNETGYRSGGLAIRPVSQ